MKLESPKVIIKKSAKDTFDFVNDVKNFETLMPTGIDKFEVLAEDKFLFQLKGMPEIILKKKSEETPSKIVFGAAGGKIDFSLTTIISSIDEASSEVQLIFEGDFNPMMGMMIKSPIKKFIATLSENMSSQIV